MRIVKLPGALFFGPDGAFFGIARIAVTVGIVIGALAIRKRPNGMAIVALAGVPTLAVGVLWLAGEPVFGERNMLVVAPYGAILAAASLVLLPGRAVAPVALASLAGTIAAAIVTQATLGPVAYDRVADGLVGLGWTSADPIVIDSQRAKTSLRVAVAWYLPERPMLVGIRASPSRCPTVFAVGPTQELGRWLARHHNRVVAEEQLAWYDHPILGRRLGDIRVVRLRGGIPPGQVVAVKGKAIPCLEATEHRG